MSPPGARERSAASADLLPARLSARSPKGEQLRVILERLIEELGPGTPLPSERVLAERYGIARMTVRTELDRLTAEGTTYRVHGAGTFVAAARIAQATSLSSFSEDMRARGLTPGSRVLFQEIVPAGDAVAGRLELAPGAPVVRVDRVRTADGTPLAIESAFLSADRFGGLATADLEGGSLYATLERDFGVRLGGAEQRVVAVPLTAAEAELLGVGADQPGLRFQTVARDATDAVVYEATSLFRGDRYEIALHQDRAAAAPATQPA